MRADLTDGVVLRRRLSGWRLVVAVAVTVAALAAALWIAVDPADRWDAGERLIAAGAAGACAVAGAALALVEFRRLRRAFTKALARVADAEAELQTLLDDLPDAVLTIDGDGIVRGATVQLGELTGIATTQLVGAPALRLVAVADRGTFAGWLADGRVGEARPLTVSLSELAPTELRRQRIELTYERPRAASSTDAIVRLRDVTEHERNTKALGMARRRFQQAFHSAPTGMALVRLDNASIVDANRSLAEMLEEPVDALLGRSILDLTHADDIEIARLHANQLERGLTDSYTVEQRYRRSGGQFVWTRTRVAVTEGEGVPLAITHIEDVSEQRRIAEQLRWAATHDDLTGLPNRAELLARVDQRLGGAPVASLTLLFIDLDNFKTVNDSLGHEIGDHLLRELADRLRQTVGREALLGRFGGDEFIVAVSRPTDAGSELFDPAFIAEQLRDTVRSAVDLHGTELFVTASIGYSLNHRAGMTAAELLRDADAAMYRAKARGRDCVEAYAPDGHETTVLALRTANELRRGLERGEIVPYYQPIVELASGHIVGFEALARWLHPERGLLGPDQFLPLAEETGLIGLIGELILRDGLAQLARWRALHVPFGEASLSVNIGTRQIVDPEFAGYVAGLLAETGVPADSLWLELTETALLADVKASIVALRNLRSLGVHLAVDDFGTGYSSLTYLKRFPVEAIKIDRSFVAGLGLDPDDSTIVEAVVRLGHSFGMSVVAEGLETPLQLNRLRELGCDRGQGYLFGRPRPAALLEHDHVVTGDGELLAGGLAKAAAEHVDS